MSWFSKRKRSPIEDPTSGTGSSEPPLPEEQTLVEQRTHQIGVELLEMARSYQAGPLSSRFWSDWLMSWTMKDPEFKTQLFRFVDVFPTLKTPRQVYDDLVDAMSQPGVKLPPGMDLGLRAGATAKGALAKTITNRITAMAQNFIAGTDFASASSKLRSRWEEGIGSSVDLLGETCVSNVEAHAYQRRYLELVETLTSTVSQWPPRPEFGNDYLGPIPKANVSIKISALSARVDPADFEGSIGHLMRALRPILDAARKGNVLVNFDMEHHALKDLALTLFERCCEAVDFPAGVALQAYLKSGEDDARRLIAWAKKTGRQVTVRLIKGAYWDYEVTHAEQMGWPVPVWTQKCQTDASFERIAELFADAVPRRVEEGGVKIALGSHNIRSLAHGLALLEKRDLPKSAIEIQMLYGMADPLKAAARQYGLLVREYVPVGEMLPGMAYLVRRLLENTSNESWLRASFSDDPADDDQLLASPHESPNGVSEDLSRETESQSVTNEPLRDFSQEDVRKHFAEQVEAAVAPEDVANATAADAEEAATRASQAFAAWRATEPLRRSRILQDAAEKMRARRDELAGIIIQEAAKTWREADADVCEAIDFCEFYARCAVDLFQPHRLGRFRGEVNQVWHQPRGVVVVISPWNFPLAITTGMTAAALVTGNAVIVKPACETPGTAKRMCDLLIEAGVPDDVLQLVAGPGPIVGDALVRSPEVAMIAFTGSKEVGLDIIEAAGCSPNGQPFIKKVVCEMGGKNAIIVDESADLDEAILGVRESAFSYAGQKCSACSRVIVVDSIHDAFLKRLVESTESLALGDPFDPATDIGPVINEAAAEKIRQYITIGRSEGRLRLACRVPPGLEEAVGRPYIGPHIFHEIEPDHRLANEEVFGPVLSVMRAEDFRKAIAMANASSFKLTGGVFSRKPSHLNLAQREFRVGNLYLNRGIIGALVGRQPFGGFGLSGMGTKAGGSEYLLQFVEERCCTENTMRRGFTPELVELGNDRNPPAHA